MNAATEAISTEIGRMKEAVRKRDGYRCTDCGITQEQFQKEVVSRRLSGISNPGKLDVHRTIPDAPYSEGICRTLCRSCHCKYRRDYVAKRAEAQPA